MNQRLSILETECKDTIENTELQANEQVEWQNV
jgi:hypothetical protein